MFQVNFSDQAISELDKLDRSEQMQLVETISNLNTDALKKPSDPLTRFKRDNKTLHRLKANGLRIYFEVNSDTIFTHYIIPQYSFTDFIFRCKLPVSEEQMVEQHQSFWKYLETLRK